MVLKVSRPVTSGGGGNDVPGLPSVVDGLNEYLKFHKINTLVSFKLQMKKEKRKT